MTAHRTISVTGFLAASWLFASLSTATAVSEPAGAPDFSWLAGSWEGRVTSGPAPGVAEVTFQKPEAGLVTGVMRLVDHGKIIVVELISIVETPEGADLRFRHFSSALEAYEPQFKQAMRLTAHDASSSTFTNLVPFDKTLASTQPRTTSFIRHGEDEFVGRSEILDDDGKPGQVEVTYRRVR